MTLDGGVFDSLRTHGGFVKFKNGSQGEISEIGVIKL